ncbi:MAG: restriction endonuclease [Thermoflexales bacterium]
MSLNLSFDLATNPASLCLSAPILALFAFLGYVAVAFIKDQADARQQQTRVEETLATFGVDRMSQAEFRRFVAGLLQKQGYTVRLPSPGHDEAEQDFGLELIAVKDGASCVVCAVRYDKPISPGTIRYANGCRARHGCGMAMVITNGAFRADARKLAQETGCALVGRAELAGWVAGEKAQ